MEHPPIFNSVEDECRYWKERAKFYHKEWIDTKQEFDEFTEDSRQLESEMETTLEQKENVIRDLRKQVVQLEHENESLRIKLDSFGIEFQNLEKQFSITQREKDKMKSHLRQLEQKNDDLERAHRVLNESIASIETMLDKAYEKNAILEIEVDEKELLQEKLQRLMDETRDLKQELNVKSRNTGNNVNGIIDKCLGNPDAENHRNIETESLTVVSAQTTTADVPSMPQSVIKRKITLALKRTRRALKFTADPDSLMNGNSAMTASSRTTALNIVADMLRKLNLDKTLLCSGCDKFRCICERPIPPISTTASCSTSTTTTPTHLTLQKVLSTSTNSVKSTASDSSNLSSISSTPQFSSNTCTSNNFGSNIFKRWTQKMNNHISTSSAENNAIVVDDKSNNASA